MAVEAKFIMIPEDNDKYPKGIYLHEEGVQDMVKYALQNFGHCLPDECETISSGILRNFATAVRDAKITAIELPTSPTVDKSE